MYKISVIIPVFNSLNYLDRCIQSVVNQASFTDYEVVLIDDGSTDGSAELCDHYRSKHGNIVVKHQENYGISLARKTGIDISSGLYAFFLDSDDWLPYSNVLELLFNQAIEYSADFVSGNHIKTKNTNLFQKTLLINSKNIHKIVITNETTLM
ncbi:glycosyltransferase family 2 protein, partial [Treponema sp. Marseille-Q4523]|uniref:glycosyltransferase family 2 protein n=1 Tax=Treponema sp. Marseille-Q4523 TaxID=2810610 RepID=UPI00195F63C7